VGYEATLDSSVMEATLGRLAPGQLRAALADFVPKDATVAERISAIEAGLRSEAGKSLRAAMARWIVDEIVPVHRLVPEAYVKWRLPVREAMIFVVERISPARLAPKLLEQIVLPEKTSAEIRLLRLIAKVPGLQKLGQVIARNRHLRPALRNALIRLENGIRDVQPDEVCTIIKKELGSRLEAYAVEIEPTILSEASVSAVVRFTWRDPASGKQERGVFKVLKPHIADYFAEDMDYLQALAEYFGKPEHNYGFPPGIIPDTFRKVRRLLQHEVNFVREQKTLLEASTLYSGLHGVRVPRLIQPLCTPGITALSEERGIKVTDAAARTSLERRGEIVVRLIEALVLLPLLSSQEHAIFHGDPHAGNLLYDNRSSDLIIVDWALCDRLSREQRRHLALLFLMVALRDAVGACNEALALSQQRIRCSLPRGKVILELVAQFLHELPVMHVPSGVDTMRLLERIALNGVKFPGSLIGFSKVVFTLDGILGDIGGSDSETGFGIVHRVVLDWLTNRVAFRSPVWIRDWIKLQCSALLYASRLCVRVEQAALDRFLPPRSSAAGKPAPSHAWSNGSLRIS
jgi:ubiquinone biosynthesis protein